MRIALQRDDSDHFPGRFIKRDHQRIPFPTVGHRILVLVMHVAVAAGLKIVRQATEGKLLIIEAGRPGIRTSQNAQKSPHGA